MSLDKNAKIYIAGHHGLVGSAIWNNLEKRGYHNLVGHSTPSAEPSAPSNPSLQPSWK